MYIELDEGYHGHRKTLRLCALMKCDTADSYPPRLWTWAARSAPDGDLTGMEPSEIELALRFRGKAGVLFDALVRAGFIDQATDGRTAIHNWQARTGGAIVRMNDRAYRVRERRAHHQGRCLEHCSICAEHVPGSDQDQSQARPNQDQSSTGKASTDQKGVAGAGAHTRSNDDAEPPPIEPVAPDRRRWTAEEWFEAYKVAWVTYRGGSYASQANDWRAIDDLRTAIRSLSVDEAVAAQARAPSMLAEYFANRDEKIADARHPWSWFVLRFNGLRFPRGPVNPKRPRTRSEENVAALADWEPPEVKTA